MKTSFAKVLLPLCALCITGCFSHGNTTSSNTETPPKPAGYVKVDKMSMVSSDLKSSYAPSMGDVKMLVIPISFAGDTADGYEDSMYRWSTSMLNNVNKYYFGEDDSLMTYYLTASLNQVRFSGKVTSVYQNTTISIKEILEDGSLNKLYDMIEDAINYVHDNDPTIDWSEYDLNQDGCIDNIHLATDYVSREWASNLWPHMFWTNRKGTIERPLANVYSITSSGYLRDPITAIHEQGHIFGLEDYYDYTENSEIDYIGQLDMQSYNVFDWNSFSKLSMGWVKPYVITGEADKVTLKLKAASINGDCLLIPADYSTWNGSAFDEYFLLELFAPYGNNKKDWNTYRSSLGTTPGVRLYHVDARVYASDKVVPWNPELLIVDDLEAQEINCKEDVAKWDYVTKGANNCSDWRAYEGGIEQLANYPLLSLIQRNGNATFGKNDSSVRHRLSSADLFKPGFNFTFDKYSKFLNKELVEQETMNNGEEFPYEISIDSINEDSCVVTVTKVK